MAVAETLPTTIKYGIGINALLPEGELSFEQRGLSSIPGKKQSLKKKLPQYLKG
jgi:hypothetical protein